MGRSFRSIPEFFVSHFRCARWSDVSLRLRHRYERLEYCILMTINSVSVTAGPGGVRELAGPLCISAVALRTALSPFRRSFSDATEASARGGRCKATPHRGLPSHDGS